MPDARRRAVGKTAGGHAAAHLLHQRSAAGSGFIPFNGGFASAAREAFSSFSALIFIGATGIAVRVLAPLVNDKFSDPAVVVIDERARHVISLLSGHAGGRMR